MVRGWAQIPHWARPTRLLAQPHRHVPAARALLPAVGWGLPTAWDWLRGGAPAQPRSSRRVLHGCTAPNLQANISHGYRPKQNPYLLLSPSKAVFW